MSWKLLQYLFNIDPWDKTEYIADKYGEKFWIDWATEFAPDLHFTVHYYGKQIGSVQAGWADDGGLTLSDINIPDCRLHDRHIGGGMLRCLIERAEEEHAKYIWGIIQPGPCTTKEKLRRWYKKHGFDVDEKKPGNYYIIMKLNNKR
jgi:hypothetical protein